MPTVTYLASFAGFLTSIINGILVPLIFAVAFLAFIWGVYTYLILGAGNEEKRKEGKNFILYGLIGFFVMISVWGLVSILVNTFGFGNSSRPPLPTFGGSNAAYNGGGGGFGGQGAGPNGTSNNQGGRPGTCFVGIWCEMGSGHVCYRGACVDPDTIP